MAKRFARLKHIEEAHCITTKTDEAFLHRLQTALLLALKDQGRLSEMQYRCAQERLNESRSRAAKQRESGASL